MELPKIKTFSITKIGNTSEPITMYAHRATCSDDAIKLWKTIMDTNGCNELMVGCFPLKDYYLTSIMGLNDE